MTFRRAWIALGLGEDAENSLCARNTRKTEFMEAVCVELKRDVLVGAVGIETTSTQIRLVPSTRCSHLLRPTGTNGTK
jgi:hypothetical protein